MSRIRILPETLANQIAAGEVVQRPASIVKELVENSLDAGAQSIWISLEHGGKSMILVRDDGQGMIEEDALLAFERHATSKIGELDDLMAINSFGFRGEALPSIASIAQVRLVTAVTDGEGTEVILEGGRVRNVKPIGCPRGTEIQIKRLFYNTPARRKFMKSTFTEYNHCLHMITKFALVQPRVAWHFEHDGKTVHHIPPAGSIRERIGQIYGEAYIQGLLDFQGEKDDFKVSGMLGNLFLSRSDRNQQYFYVNQRPVYNLTMRNALTAVTKNVLPKGKYPVIFICIECAPGSVDVNVHPAKTEVRFREEWTVYDLLVAILSQLLSKHVPKTTPYVTIPSPSFSSPSVSEPEDRLDQQLPEHDLQQFQSGANTPRVAGSSVAVQTESETAVIPDAALLGVSGPSSLEELTPPPSWQKNTEFFSSLRFIGQVFRSFLLFETATELVMLDQHAAHERILFEKIRDKLEKQTVPIQHLLVPETIDFSPAEFAFVRENAEVLAAVGFSLDQFGRNTYIIRAVPAWIGQQDPRPVFLDILDELRNRLSSGGDNLEGRLSVAARQELAKIMACKAAIKVHRNINSIEAQDLIRQLAETMVPFTCPHGRPIIITFTFHDLARFFKRC